MNEWAIPLALLAASVALLMGVIALIRWIGQRRSWDGEVSRKSL